MNRRRLAGILLVECVVYFSVFAIITGVGFAAFYLCWNQSTAMVRATEDIGLALHAGERWRADVRHATGKISLKKSAAGEEMRIPGRTGTVVYRFETNTMFLEVPARHTSAVLLAKVKSSQMILDPRNVVTAWRWELELNQRRPETKLPLAFTFEAPQPAP
jgi:hypothetical protein